jgi:hypothetical protein
MSTVSVFAGITWTSSTTRFRPGEVHNWEAWGITSGVGFDDAILVTSVPGRLSGPGGPGFSSALIVENIRTVSYRNSFSDRAVKVTCQVRNVGYDDLTTYKVNFFRVSG